MNLTQKRLTDHVDNQNTTLESTVENVKALLNIQRESIEVVNNIVAECANAEARNKKVIFHVNSMFPFVHLTFVNVFKIRLFNALLPYLENTLKNRQNFRNL